MLKSAWLKMIACGVACSTIVMTGAQAQNQPPIQLTMGLKPGQSVRFGFQEVESLTNKSATIRDGQATNVYQTEAQVVFRGVEATSEGLLVEMMYERVKFQAHSPVMKEPPSFDTAAPVAEALENPLAPALLAVLNKPIMLHLTKSGRIISADIPKVDVPDVKHGGIGEQMLTAEWIIARFQPAFSLTAPGPDVPASLWNVPSEMPIVHGVEQPLRVDTMNVLRETKDGIASVSLLAKAQIVPPQGEDPLNAQNFRFAGTGTATWNIGDGLLGVRSMKYEWSFDALPQPTLPTHVDAMTQTVLARLK